MASAIAIGGSALLGAGASIYGANKAESAQNRANNRAMDLQREQYEQGREDLMGARDAIIDEYGNVIRQGDQALDMTGALSGAQGVEAQEQAYANFRENPAVAFQREQGMRNLEQDAAVTGMGGGSRLKALSRFNQGLAEQSFSDYYNRLIDQRNYGGSARDTVSQARLNAAGSTAELGTRFADTGSTLLQNRGNIAANAAIGRANTVSDLISTGGSMVSDYFNNRGTTGANAWASNTP